MRQSSLIFNANILITLSDFNFDEERPQNGYVLDNFSFYFCYNYYMLFLLEIGAKVKVLFSLISKVLRKYSPILKYGTNFLGIFEEKSSSY